MELKSKVECTIGSHVAYTTNIGNMNKWVKSACVGVSVVLDKNAGLTYL
jgi:hypothetical protein